MDYIATFVDGHKASTLVHYGIKKQEWGVRRFQNPDGTLTEEGRRRYGVGAAASRAYEKSARYKAKSDSYAFKSRRALDKYDQFKSDKLKRKSEKYAVKSSNQYAKAVKLSNKDDKIVNRKYSESDIYALEGAKRAGLLGAAVGKAVGVYKERQASRQDSYRLAKDDNKIDLGKDGDVPEHEYGTRTKEISANKIADENRKARAEFSEPHKSSGRYTTGSKSNKEIGKLLDSGEAYVNTILSKAADDYAYDLYQTIGNKVYDEKYQRQMEYLFGSGATDLAYDLIDMMASDPDYKR